MKICSSFTKRTCSTGAVVVVVVVVDTLVVAVVEEIVVDCSEVTEVVSVSVEEGVESVDD